MLEWAFLICPDVYLGVNFRFILPLPSLFLEVFREAERVYTRYCPDRLYLVI